MLGNLVMPFFDVKRVMKAGLKMEEVVVRVRDEKLREEFEEGAMQLMEDHPGVGLRMSVEDM